MFQVIVVFHLITLALSQQFLNILHLNISPSEWCRSDFLYWISCELGLLTNLNDSILLVIVFDGEYMPFVYISLRVLFLIKCDNTLVTTAH